MALCDADYCITYANIGMQGRMSDGGVFQYCEFFKKLANQELNLPSPEKVVHGNTELPYVIVGDSAFPLKENLMVPYPGIHEQKSKKRIYSYRLSRARRIIENVFGIMSNVFRVLRKPMALQPEKAALITRTCIYLHNFLRSSKSSCMLYTPPGSLDSDINGTILEGSWRSEDQSSAFTELRKIARKSSNDATNVRDEFAEYFFTTGKVAWQDNM